MRCFSSLLSLGFLASLGASFPLQSSEGDSGSLRKLPLWDVASKAAAPSEKYFHESTFHPRYDGRFAERPLGYAEQKKALKNLLQTYLMTSNDLGTETWLMHGSLMGWWWNKKTLPWDSNINVQITEPTIFYLAAYYNMSTFFLKTQAFPKGREYLLEVNPNYKNREQNDKLNSVDARWIDTESGLFMDITTARYNLTHPQGEGMMSCKDGQEFKDTYVFPLRNTYYEGVLAKIPFRFKDFLVSEFGEEALVNTDANDHHFNEDKMEWVPNLKELQLESKMSDIVLEPFDTTEKVLSI